VEGIICDDEHLAHLVDRDVTKRVEIDEMLFVDLVELAVHVIPMCLVQDVHFTGSVGHDLDDDPREHAQGLRRRVVGERVGDHAEPAEIPQDVGRAGPGRLAGVPRVASIKGIERVRNIVGIDRPIEDALRRRHGNADKVLVLVRYDLDLHPGVVGDHDASGDMRHAGKALLLEIAFFTERNRVVHVTRDLDHAPLEAPDLVFEQDSLVRRFENANVELLAATADNDLLGETRRRREEHRCSE